MIVKQDFFVGVQFVDDDKLMTNRAILEMFSDLSMLHSYKAGHTTISGLSPVSWVVINWKMKVLKRARLFSTVHAEAWIQKAAGYRAIRQYAAYDENGDVVARAVGEWVAMDAIKGTFIRLKPEFMDLYQIEPDKDENGTMFTEFQSTDLLRDCPEPDITKEADVFKCFFDYNGHVHNSEYLNFAEHILPKEFSMQQMDELELQFKLEVRADEPKVQIDYSEQENQHFIKIRNPENGEFHMGLILTDSSVK